MPVSASETIPFEIEWIRKYCPSLTSVLDVGFGYGKGAFLIRSFIEAKTNQRYTPDEWRIKIDGVDIFDGYLSELQRILYDHIYIGDIFTILPSLGTYDIALLGDIIEHLTKKDGYRLLDELFLHVNNIFISTPFGYIPNTTVNQNTYEVHQSGWVPEDFKKYHIIDCTVLNRIRRKGKAIAIYLGKKKN